jgi:hypothetical protein
MTLAFVGGIVCTLLVELLVIFAIMLKESRPWRR